MLKAKLLQRSIVATILTSLLIAGCSPPSDPMLEMLDADIGKTKIDDLERTLDFLFAEVRFEQGEFKQNLSSGLNRWVTYSEEKFEDLQWSEDEMAREIVAANKELQLLERNDEFNFLNTDAFYLQESVWLSQVASRAVQHNDLKPFELYRMAADDFRPDEDSETPIMDTLGKLHPELKEKELQTLTDSFKVFDWIVRNTQLLTDTTDLPEDVEELKLNKRTESLAAAGVPGLGYKRYPYQVLLYGRADYVERAKVMLAGLRTINIDAVVLAVKVGDQQMPWVVGVPIGDDYYLFDPKMALPLPGAKVGTIATLAEVRKNPELLSQLDLNTDESLEDDTDYWVTKDQLDDLEALVYVTPESISRRMAALERSLTGDLRMVLSYGSKEIADRLPKIDGVTVKAWDIAFQTHAFRQAVREGLEQTSNNTLRDRLMWHYQDEAYVDNFVIYRTARTRFLKGKFTSLPNAKRRNAVESFQRMMYSDEDIARLGTDPVLQTLHGIRKKQSQSVQQFKSLVSSVQSQMELIRRDSGIFLVQSLFDNGSVNAASNWLEVLKDEDKAERWKEQVTYLSGRSFEGLREYIKAIEALSDPKLAQAHGNLIRARMLKKLIIQLYGEDSFQEAVDLANSEEKSPKPKSAEKSEDVSATTTDSGVKEPKEKNGSQDPESKDKDDKTDDTEKSESEMTSSEKQKDSKAKSESQSDSKSDKGKSEDDTVKEKADSETEDSSQDADESKSKVDSKEDSKSESGSEKESDGKQDESDSSEESKAADKDSGSDQKSESGETESEGDEGESESSDDNQSDNKSDEDK